MNTCQSILIASAICFLSCGSESKTDDQKQFKKEQESLPELSVTTSTDTTIQKSEDLYTAETFETTGTPGWGYRIMLNGELYINQPHIPAVQGNKGFSNPMFAKITADYAISKIQKGIVPPTLTVEELDSLGVLK